jgi:hypothetical protein
MAVRPFFALMLLLAEGCSAGSISCGEGCGATWFRLATDTSIGVTSKDGTEVSYSSNPQAALIDRLLATITALAARIPPAPEGPD